MLGPSEPSPSHADMSAVVEASARLVQAPSATRLEAVVRRGRFLKARSRAVALTVALTVVAGLAFPLRALVSLQSDRAPAVSVGGRAELLVGVDVPSGWDAYSVDPDGLGPVVRLANFPLPLPTSDFHGSVASMPADGILIALKQFVGICGCAGFSAEAFPVSISRGDLVEAAGHDVASQAFTADNGYFALYVEFGSYPVPQSSLDEANAVLATLSSGTEPPQFMTPPAPYPPPYFTHADGWNVLAQSGLNGSESVPIAWASTVPFSASDLEASVSMESLAYVPALANLPPDGVVLTAALPLAGNPTPPDNPNFPDATLPLQLSDAAVDGGWEGQPAPNVVRYRIWARVNGQYVDVRVYFGAPHPSAEVLQLAQDELSRLVVPSRAQP